MPRASGPASSAGCGTRAIDCGRIEKPEIHRVDLSGPLLSILAWGASPDTFEWFDKPADARMASALALLQRLGAVAAVRSRRSGAQMQRLPLHPRLARVLIAARGSFEGCAACAWLSEPTQVRRTARRHIVRSAADPRPVAAHAAAPATGRRSTSARITADRSAMRIASESTKPSCGARCWPAIRTALRSGGRRSAGGTGRRQGDARYRTRRRDRPGERRPRRRLADRARRDVGTGIRDDRGDHPARIANRAGMAGADIERGDA